MTEDVKSGTTTSWFYCCPCFSWLSSNRVDGALARARTRIGTLGVNARLHCFTRTLADDYTLSCDVLGKGFNGNVYVAHSKKSPGKFAVKSFRLSTICNEDTKLVLNEVAIYLSIDHPHIVRLVDVYRGESSIDLVMECMGGGTVLKRVIDRKRFTERDAVEAVWQMLLALNYLHSLDIVHRDIKLENFLYENKESSQLKLIDFGFSKIWNRCSRMRASCGTLQYVAPEVLEGSYTAQCDMWSLGVASFILLTGKMPFGGQRHRQISAIKSGQYNTNFPIWDRLSGDARNFINHLLVVNPQVRYTPKGALHHAWVARRDESQASKTDIDKDIVYALQDYAHASTFRRTVMYAMAWSLTNEERNLLHDAFLEIDTDRSGTISLGEFKQLLAAKFHLNDGVIQEAFHQIDSNHSEQLEYSEFLAACASARIHFHKDLFVSTFRRFDDDDTGFITADRLRQVIGPDECTLAEASQMMLEADLNHDGKIPLGKFTEYLEETHRAGLEDDPLLPGKKTKDPSRPLYSGVHKKVSKLTNDLLQMEKQNQPLQAVRARTEAFRQHMARPAGAFASQP